LAHRLGSWTTAQLKRRFFLGRQAKKKSSVRSQPAANPDGFFLLSVLLVFLRFLLNLFAAALNVLAGALDCIAAGKPGEEDVRCSKH